MAEKRDYYEVLGLSKNATANEIKKAYREAALKWHPDKWVDGTEAEKKNAEEKFKEASEAYGVLSDENKKAKYDQFGFAGFDGSGAGDFAGGFGDLEDLLNNIFTGFGGGFSGFGGGGFSGFGSNSRREDRVYKGRDIRTRVKLSLEEIYTGCSKEITIERNKTCPDCSGKGCKKDSDYKTCTYCSGTGQTQQVINSFLGRTVAYSSCPHCMGEGKVIKNPCSTCAGKGVLRQKEVLNINIPAGVEDNMQLTIEGKGHAARNAVNGDLLIVIEELPHANLRRNGANLFYSEIISVTDAILGTDLSIPCLDGNYKITLEPGTQSGTIVKLRNKGLPNLKSYSKGNGDLYVKILVWIPRKLNKNQVEFFKSIKDDKEMEPALNMDDKNLFDKEKNIF